MKEIDTKHNLVGSEDFATLFQSCICNPLYGAPAALRQRMVFVLSTSLTSQIAVVHYFL